MRTPPLQHVNCILFHDEYQPLELEFLIEAISSAARSANLGQTIDNSIYSNGHNAVLFADRAYRLNVYQLNEPAHPGNFSRAISSLTNAFNLPQLPDLMTRHKSNTLISIKKCVTDNTGAGLLREAPADNAAFMADSPAFTTSGELARAKKAAREIVKIILERRPVSFLYWGIGQNFYTPRLFLESEKFADGLTQDLHLEYFGGKDPAGLEDLHGIVFHCSQYLIGKLVLVKASPAPIGWIEDRGMHFIRHCMLQGEVIPHGDTFSLEGEDAVFQALHKDGPENTGIVELVIRHAPRFGIFDDAFRPERRPAPPKALPPQPARPVFGKRTTPPPAQSPITPLKAPGK